MVEHDGAGDHGQPGSARARRRADEQLLPRRSRHRRALRARHVLLRQPGGPRGGEDAGPDSAMLGGCDRAIRRRRVRASADAGEPAGRDERDRPLSEPQRAGRDDRRHQGLRRVVVVTPERPRGSGPDEALLEESAEDLYEHAPCGYLSTMPDGRIVRANATLLEWTAETREALLGGRTFQSLLTIGSRIYYETHYAPLLRMQGF